jgi:ubiquinone/menaquinone biosynthesis C-methylase UbiE
VTDVTKRFSDRVENYLKYRPGYPAELVPAIIENAKLDKTAEVADVGSGTGIFTRSLLEHDLKVYGVEPNTNMRLAAEDYLAEYSRFSSIDARAENTGLDTDSVDLITVAQAFHWFNNSPTRAEFRRILKPGGSLALIWNKRKISQPFQQAYAALLCELAPDYGTVNHMNLTDDDIAAVFASGQMQLLRFDNSQHLQFAGLVGRLKSASYCPPENTPQYESLINEMDKLFKQYVIDGSIAFEYDTRLYLGPME